MSTSDQQPAPSAVRKTMASEESKLSTIGKWFRRKVEPLLLPGSSTPVPDKILTGIIEDALADAFRRRPELSSEPEQWESRAQQANVHLIEAGRILSGIQEEAQRRSLELQTLLDAVKANRDEFERLQTINTLTATQKDALMSEMRSQLQEQLRAELARGQSRRRVLGLISAAVTLIVGALLGAVVQHWYETGSFMP